MRKSRGDRWVMGGGAVVFLIIAFPLWAEFHELGNTVWNAFLIALLIGIAVCALVLQRYFRQHIGEIGEARFDTRNKTNG